MSIKFFHKRRYNPDGTIKSHGGVTIAYVTNEQDQVIASAGATCHERDNFCKAQGRVKAQGRLRSAHYVSEYNPPINKDVFLRQLATM